MLLRRFFPFVLVLMTACETTMPSDLNITPDSIWGSGQVSTPIDVDVTPTLSYSLPRERLPGDPIVAPTPDAPHFSVAGVHGSELYVIQSGDILSEIAEEYGVSLEAINEANGIANPDNLVVGQELIIPAIDPQPTGPTDKIIPDSELVFGPVNSMFDVGAYIQAKQGYLSTYTEDVHGEVLGGAEIILHIAQAYSINPRILLALLDYQSGWLTDPHPEQEDNPFGYIDDWYTGLYRQLAWVCVHLNSGYYRWRAGIVTHWFLEDGTVIPVAPTINAGTAAVQNYFAQLDDLPTWLSDVSPHGFYEFNISLFGYPFDLAVEPLIPGNLLQPYLQLPFGEEETWSFTGGPHMSWDAGSPFGALDFAPPGEGLACGTEVDYWVTAVAAGLVTRASNGAVILDLDLDGNEGTGWVILYMHIESRDRVQPGTFLRIGESLGHPSCEGGVSDAIHVHLARKFNGEWIPADGTVPFNLEGWIPAGTGEEYVGTLTRAGEVVEAFNGTGTVNLIHH